MEAKTKKRLLIGGSLFVIVGIGIYLLYKYKKNKPVLQDNNTKPEEPPKSGAPTNTGIPTGVAKAELVNLTDLLTGSGINAANNKAIYAGIGGLKVYNMAGKVVKQPNKNEFLGTIYAVTQSTGGVYWVEFLFKTVHYKMPSTGLFVKIN